MQPLQLLPRVLGRWHVIARRPAQVFAKRGLARFPLQTGKNGGPPDLVERFTMRRIDRENRAKRSERVRVLLRLLRQIPEPCQREKATARIGREPYGLLQLLPGGPVLLLPITDVTP